MAYRGKVNDLVEMVRRLLGDLAPEDVSSRRFSRPARSRRQRNLAHNLINSRGRPGELDYQLWGRSGRERYPPDGPRRALRRPLESPRFVV